MVDLPHNTLVKYKVIIIVDHLEVPVELPVQTVHQDRSCVTILNQCPPILGRPS